MPELKALIQQLTSGEDDQAEAAAQAIHQFGRRALFEIEPLLSDSNADVRWWAVRALAGLRDMPEVDDLLQNALHDLDPAVRQCAALGFSTHPSADMVPELIECLSSKDQLLARLAANALIVIGSDAVPALIDVMERGPQIARLEAVKALAEIGDERAIPIFFRAIKDGDSQLIEYWSDVGLEKLGIGMTFFKP